MAFTETLARLPHTATTPNGRGFLPPLIRAMGHILYLRGCIADPDVTVTTDNALTELNAALEHWRSRVNTPGLSTTTTTYATDIEQLLVDAIYEYHGWTEEARGENIRAIADRLAQFCTAMDREYAGIRDSDAGTTL